MRAIYKLLALGVVLGAPLLANADVLRIATWNLGWHISQQELSPWITQCSKTYAKDTQGVWRLAPAGTPGAKQGWDISEPRVTLEGVDLSVMPPCAVYTTVARKGIEVTKASYSKRLTQIGRVLSSDVRPDVIAFQEVSGAQAVREALGPASVDYNVCSFDSAYKVQRLAFAWKKAPGNAVEACTDVKAMSLPQLAPEQRVRPGYVVTLNLRGKKVRLFTVHLKSGCVSSLEGDRLDGNVGANDPCPILQQQVQPLEEVWEQLPIGVDYFIVLGDFNRNLWHEANKVAGSEPVRSDSGTDLTTPRVSSVSTRNLVLEVNDGVPASSKAILLSATCAGSADVVLACEASKTAKLITVQRQVLTASTGLGCRNPVGLDHVLVSQSLVASVKSTSKVSIGSLGISLAARPPQFVDPQLAISDHCPVVTEIEF